MTITTEGTTKALFILDRCNLNAAKQGQAGVWAEIIRDARPSSTDADILDAVKRIATQRSAESKGGTWVAPGDVIAEMRKAANHRKDSGWKAPEIEGPPADPEQVKQIIAKAVRGTDAFPEAPEGEDG